MLSVALLAISALFYYGFVYYWWKTQDYIPHQDQGLPWQLRTTSPSSCLDHALPHSQTIPKTSCCRQARQNVHIWSGGSRYVEWQLNRIVDSWDVISAFDRCELCQRWTTYGSTIMDVEVGPECFCALSLQLQQLHYDLLYQRIYHCVGVVVVYDGFKWMSCFSRIAKLSSYIYCIHTYVICLIVFQVPHAVYRAGKWHHNVTHPHQQPIVYIIDLQ